MAEQTPSAAAQAARLKMFAIRTRDNEKTMYIFAGVMGGLLAMFTFFHVFRMLGRKYSKHSHESPSSFRLLVRKIRNLAIRKAPGLPTIGHAATIAVYVAVNVALTFTNLNLTNMPMIPNLASRTGWMAIANFFLVVVLSLKNTPLSFFTWSYERLNILHRYSGWATLIFTILHLSFYSKYFVSSGHSERLRTDAEIWGMVSAGGFFMLIFSGVVIRRFWYELFYIVHIVCWIVAVVALGLHQPELGKHILQVTCVCAGLWVLDRIIRLGRLLINYSSNEVTLYPLSNGATRVCLKKPPFMSASGQHCFLWVPKIRMFETHPFTIASNEPCEFVITSHDGFTADLHRWAVTHPGITLTASVDGSYGSVPDPSGYDKTIFVGGGSGASFVFGTALHSLKSIPAGQSKALLLVWVVRNASQLRWYARDIKDLAADERVDVRLFITRSESINESDSDSDDLFTRGNNTPVSSSSQDAEKGVVASDSDDAAAAAEGTLTHFGNAPISYGRPNIGPLIEETVGGMMADQRILVMGCGPSGLMNMVRDTTASCLHGKAPSVELHCEEFGW